MSIGSITATGSVDLPEDGTILELTGGENPLTFLNMSEADTALALIDGMSDRNRIEGWRRAEQQFFDPPREVILNALDEQEQSVGEQRIMTDGGQCVDDTDRREPDHGEADESETRFWCTQCKTYVPEFNWDFHERYHDPDRELPSGDTNIGRSQDAETDRGDDLRADGGPINQTTDEIILEQIDALQSEGEHGAPIGEVVDAALDECEVKFSEILETISWLHNHGQIYQPARGYLRRTDAVEDLGGESA